MTRTIEVLGKPRDVNVQRKYKAVWIAAGEYLGARIEVREKTEAEVVAAWLWAAEACERH